MLSHLLPLLEKAESRGYAIPAFNITNLETLQAVIAAAAETRSPVIIATSRAAIGYAGHETILALMEAEAARLGRKIPVVTHLDHGKDWPTVKSSILLGYRSVHMDASERPLAQNIRLTRQAVLFGHRHHVTVQGELGYLLGYEGMMAKAYDRKQLPKIMTDPDQAANFVASTGVDTLAIAVGTAHGRFIGKEEIDFKRLTAIKKKVTVPLVLHGGSGVTPVEIKRAIRAGIRIINIDTELRLRFMSGLVRGLKSYNPKKRIDVRTYLETARKSMEREAVSIIKLFGSYRQA